MNGLSSSCGATLVYGVDLPGGYLPEDLESAKKALNRKADELPNYSVIAADVPEGFDVIENGRFLVIRDVMTGIARVQILIRENK